MTTFVLVHSPIVGPSSWSLIHRELRQCGVSCLVPTLTRDDSPEPFWQRDASAPAEALAALPDGESIVLVGHSGAGFLLPAIRQLADRPIACNIFVDAEIPNGQARAGSEGFRDFLDSLYNSGQRYPNWTDDGLTSLVPDAELRRNVLADMRPQPREFWTETVPLVDGWPDAPCAFLLLSGGYKAELARAIDLGWPCADLPTGHFGILTEPLKVTDALLTLAAQSGIECLPAVIPPFR